MPSRNIIKTNVSNTYYHVYTRGVSKQKIFIDESDYLFFFTLFERYLSEGTTPISPDENYKKLNDSVEALVYCLMPNHFHLLVYQINESGMAKLMHGIMTSYSRYFNKKYGRSGPLFESRYKAARIDSDEHLFHISRYIHRNADEWLDYPYSSLRAYLYDDVPCWLKKNRVLKLYGSAVKYLEFLDDYEEKSK